MSHRVMPFVMIWLQAAVELILFFPVFKLLHESLLSVNLWSWMLELTLFYIAGYCVSFFLHVDKWYSLAFAALCISWTIAIGLSGLSIGGYATGVIGFYLFFRGVFMANRSWKMMFHLYYYWSGLALYFVVSFIYRFKHEAQGFETELFWFGLLSIAITLFNTSQEQIIQESLPEKTGRHLVNPALLWQNRLLTAALFVTIACVAAFKQLSHGIVWINHWFWRSLLYLLQKPTPRQDAIQTDTTTKVKPAPPLLTGGNPSAFLQWLEKIVYYLFAAVITAALLVGVYFMGKWLIRYTRIVYRWLLLRVRSTKNNEIKGYEDESTRLFNWKHIKDSYRGKVSDWLDQLRKREQKWSELKTNAERVRFIYRELLHRSTEKGYEAKPYHTVQEVIHAISYWKPELSPKSEKLARLYNKARYSTHPIDDHEVEDLR